ncbi:MAG TPA: hypothetical protein PKM67_11615, partial [Kiritimatiellia bacterium]|nr:hypothetical protein [Kiritimatiellia bacterium]
MPDAVKLRRSFIDFRPPRDILNENPSRCYVFCPHEGLQNAGVCAGGAERLREKAQLPRLFFLPVVQRRALQSVPEPQKHFLPASLLQILQESAQTSENRKTLILRPQKPKNCPKWLKNSQK